MREILHSIGVNNTLKDNADDIIETGCYFINLYNESKINFPHKGAFASLLVCSYKETECVFQHSFSCEDGKLSSMQILFPMSYAVGIAI